MAVTPTMVEIKRMCYTLNPHGFEAIGCLRLYLIIAIPSPPFETLETNGETQCLFNGLKQTCKSSKPINFLIIIPSKGGKVDKKV